MNPQELPLADIHTPAQIALWPLAYGWWIVIALVLIALFFVFRAMRKWRKQRVQRNFAIDELKAVDLKHYAAWQQINEIIKRAAMEYYDREQVASLTGEKWKVFLLQGLGKKAPEFDDHWLNFAYTAKVDQDKVYSYHTFAEQWLKHALPARTSKSGGSK